MNQEDYDKRQAYLETADRALKTIGATLHLEQSKLKDLRYALNELESLEDVKTYKACRMLKKLIGDQEQAVRKAKREREALEKLKYQVEDSLTEMRQAKKEMRQSKLKPI